MNSDDILKKLEKNLMHFDTSAKTANVGTVVSITDNIVVATGLSKALMGEEVSFEDGTLGLILNLDEDSVSIVLLGKPKDITEGDTVKTTGKILQVMASEELLGRIVNPVGLPLDGKAAVKKGTPMPLERIAAGVIDRQPVDTALKTGIKSIDALFPIGRGQRELIIGDRGLGKTAIAIDTIINQKEINDRAAKDKTGKIKRVLCVYVAIGQKQSTVAQVVEKLRETGALDYTIIVAANAADQVSLQYLAPYAGVAIAEYFMEKGEDVLIVYDDLTKHAWAYRQISLVLKRPAGREAYPGDIFYVHSRLLERAVRLNENNGGGSITALPVIETQADDISAYIPTNVISITDGQIFLKSDLFNSGIRPAIDVGLSVSRVGGAAQTGAMKSVSGRIKLELAQYKELAVFAQFGSDLDAATLSQLERGKRLTEVLKQPQYSPLSEANEILSIWAVTNGFADDVPVDQILRFEKEYHEFVARTDKTLIETLLSGAKIKEETTESLKKVTTAFKKVFTA
ncbi:MAG TPA: F0F1 ATP synthase subunit alpha [Patescibacteria group bacterium]|nr:F0F1 ATP synthase subunit alpha [Patescibacteria group bacterium]